MKLLKIHEYAISEFEEKHNVTVYHVIYTNTSFGKLLNYMYVSNNQDEWELDIDDIKQGYALVYVNNLSDDNCSEFGSIGIKNVFGGLIRTA